MLSHQDTARHCKALWSALSAASTPHSHTRHHPHLLAFALSLSPTFHDPSLFQSIPPCPASSITPPPPRFQLLPTHTNQPQSPAPPSSKPHPTCRRHVVPLLTSVADGLLSPPGGHLISSHYKRTGSALIKVSQSRRLGKRPPLVSRQDGTPI
jgi:hypothetical protein